MCSETMLPRRRLQDLQYTNAVLREALRLYPPAWIFVRQSLAEDHVAGCRIPAGTVLTLSPWVTHRSSLLWSEPTRFEPERFLRDPSLGLGGGRNFAYLPFGGGAHVCIGNHFAMTEALLGVGCPGTTWTVRVLQPDAWRQSPLRPSRSRADCLCASKSPCHHDESPVVRKRTEPSPLELSRFALCLAEFLLGGDRGLWLGALALGETLRVPLWAGGDFPSRQPRPWTAVLGVSHRIDRISSREGTSSDARSESARDGERNPASAGEHCLWAVVLRGKHGSATRHTATAKPHAWALRHLAVCTRAKPLGGSLPRTACGALNAALNAAPNELPSAVHPPDLA